MVLNGRGKPGKPPGTSGQLWQAWLGFTALCFVPPLPCDIYDFSDQFDFDTVVRALHPTPALGGYPSKPSFQWLYNHIDQRDRSLFGAPFGVCDNQGNYHVVVSIRNVQWQSDRLSVWAGCGIVPESQFESEWAELGAKIDSVKAIFSLK